eukprot:GHVU01028292.1.p2 GENE.GHVU01028292.1~~GHVU01028292.1.p2  ORF type:complete len:170 (-),score=33.73 GHVU01028292.1:3151-3660(-)
MDDSYIRSLPGRITKTERQEESKSPRRAAAAAANKGHVKVVFVVGRRASGKTTLCNGIKRNASKWTHIVVGDILKQEAAQGAGQAGPRIAEQLNKGEEAADAGVVEVLLRTIGSLVKSKSRKFLVEGFPQTANQAQLFKRDFGTHPSLCLTLDVAEAVTASRSTRKGGA